jgi:hypothetical protein
VKFVIGGRSLETNSGAVVAAVEGLEPDAVRKFEVEIGGVHFPPKQVLATVSGWDRQSFTTQEARRVLEKLGFKCKKFREVVPDDDANDEHSDVDATTGSLRAAIDVLNVAVAELTRRVAALEER